MSLINQMLKDIDKRHASSPSTLPAHHDLQGVMASPFPLRGVLAFSALTVAMTATGVWILTGQPAATPVVTKPSVAVANVAAAVPEATSEPTLEPVPAPEQILAPVLAAPPLEAMAPLLTIQQPTTQPVVAMAAVREKPAAPNMLPNGVITRVLTLEQRAINLHRDATELVKQGRLADAQALLRDALAIAPRHAESHALLATMLQRDGRHAEAVEHFVIALRQTPESANGLLGLGISLQALKDTANAADAFQRALELGLSPSLMQFAQDRLRQLRP